MGLPWVRLDSNICLHDKTAVLLTHGRPGEQAFILYVGSLGYAGMNGTDGYIARPSLPMICPLLKNPEKLARLLVDVRLWDYAEGGWVIPNYLDRQPSAAVSEATLARKSAAARKANCIRWHGPDCGCNNAQANDGAHAIPNPDRRPDERI
jgi:hypothetical protein